MNNDIFLVVALAVLIAFMFMNSRKRKKQVQDLQSSVKVGANVMLHSGIVGKVTSIEGDRIILESVPGTKLKVVRAAVRSIESQSSTTTTPASKKAAPAQAVTNSKAPAKTTKKKPAVKKAASK